MHKQKRMRMEAERETFLEILERSQHELNRHGTLTLTALSTEILFFKSTRVKGLH